MRDDTNNRLQAAALLVIALVLLATVGGFGALFSLLISPAIRAYNRVAPFIAFLALAAVGRLGRSFHPRSGRCHGRRPPGSPFWSSGVADQYPALRDRAGDLPVIASELADVSSFVARLEAALPPNAIGLPVAAADRIPLDAGQRSSGAYDQFKPYLTAHQLRWSYPALTEDQLVWQNGVEGVPQEDLPRYLARQGFSAILISRAGYPDGGAALEQVFLNAGGATRLDASDRYIALDVRHLQPAGPR